MELKLSDIEKIFENIMNITNNFEGKKIDTRVTRMYLAAHNSIIDYNVPKNKIPHLLGINTIYLESTGLFNSKNAYNVMIELLSKGAYWLYNESRNKHISLSDVFSDYINEKIEAFEDNILTTKKESVEFVCKINPETLYLNGEDKKIYDYIILKKTDNQKYSMLYLAYDKNLRKYVPISNRIYNSKEEAINGNINLLKGQTLTLITGIEAYNLFTDYKAQIRIPSDEKLKKGRLLQEYSKLFICNIDVTHDYFYCLDKYFSYLQTVAGSDEEQVNRLNKQNSELINELLKLKEQVEALQKQNTYLSSQNTKLSTSNKGYKKRIKLIGEIVSSDEEI